MGLTEDFVKVAKTGHSVLGAGIDAVKCIQAGSIPIPIVMKTREVDIFFVQGRRVCCEKCGKPFTFLLWGKRKGTAVGLPILSGKEEMGERCIKTGLRRIGHFLANNDIGCAACPSCEHTQGWMLEFHKRAVVKRRLKWGLGSAWFIGWFIGFALVLILFLMSWDMEEGGLLAAMLLPVPVSLILGVVWAVRSVRRPPDDAYISATDEDLRAWIEACEVQELNPILAWYSVVARSIFANKSFIAALLEMRFHYDESAIPISFGIRNLAKDKAFEKYDASGILDNYLD